MLSGSLEDLSLILFECLTCLMLRKSFFSSPFSDMFILIVLYTILKAIFEFLFLLSKTCDIFLLKFELAVVSAADFDVNESYRSIMISSMNLLSSKSTTSQDWQHLRPKGKGTRKIRGITMELSAILSKR